MAYSFPPRGFFPPVNNQQFSPNLSRPPFPPPRQPFPTPSGPPRGYSVGHDGPAHGGEAPQFGPLSLGRFPHPNARGGDDAAGPSGRGMWPTGMRAAGPGVPPGMPGQFPPQRPMGMMGPDLSFGWFQHPANMAIMTMTGDITECESWPGLPGRQKSPHNVPGGGQNADKNSGPSNCQKGGPSAWTKQRNKAPRNRQNRKASKTVKQASVLLEHYCDVCDRGFKTTTLLDEHFAQHVKCKHPGCKFEGHFKVVKLHTKLQHSFGSKKVTWFDSPGEIAKWKADRKRNYPTVGNITKKAEVVKSNEEKGVVLQNKYFGKMRQPKRGRQRARDFREDQGIAAKWAKADSAQNGRDFSAENTVSSKDPRDEGTASSSKTHHQGEMAPGGHLGSLAALAAYGDSSEEEGEIPQDAPKPSVDTPPQKQSSSLERSSRQRKWSWKGGRGKKTRSGARGGRRVKDRQEQERQVRLKNRPNLLEMLLAPEIRRERNTILQCVRYVVQNDFFGVNQGTGYQRTKQESQTGPSVKDVPMGEEPRVQVEGTNRNCREGDVRGEDGDVQDAKEENTDSKGSERNDVSHVEEAVEKHHDINGMKVKNANAKATTSSQEGKGMSDKVGMATEEMSEACCSKNGDGRIVAVKASSNGEEESVDETEMQKSLTKRGLALDEAFAVDATDAPVVTNGENSDKLVFETDTIAGGSTKGIGEVTAPTTQESDLEKCKTVPNGTCFTQDGELSERSGSEA